MLTESEVQRSFRKLFTSPEISQEAIEKGEALIDELRLESPLRHRLGEELEQLRGFCASES